MTLRNLLYGLSLLAMTIGTPGVVQAQPPSPEAILEDALAQDTEVPIEDELVPDIDGESVPDAASPPAAEAAPEEPMMSANEAYNQGVDRYQQNDYDTALELFDYTIDRNPEFANAYLYRGMTYAALENYNTALDDLNQGYFSGTGQPHRLLHAGNGLLPPGGCRTGHGRL